MVNFQHARASDDDISAAADLSASRVTPALCSSLAEQITREGIGIIPQFFSAPLIAEAARFAQDAVAANNGEYISFGGSEGLPGFLLGQMDKALWFQELCQNIYRELVGKVPPPPRFSQVLRCLSGRTGRTNSNYFHYDSYALTMLVPVMIPEPRERGRLILFPNARPFRRSYALNAFEKAVVDRKWVQNLIRRRTNRNSRSLRIELEPGNLYVFCGYRSLHTNEPCGEQDLRATLLFHYANPHEESRLRRAFRGRRAE